MKHISVVLVSLFSFVVCAQEKSVTPPQALKLDGVPPIAQAAAEATSRYVSFRNAAFLDWHPVDRAMLITTRFSETNQIHIVEEPKGAREQLTFFNEPVSLATMHPRTGTYLVFAKDVGGGEWYQLYRYDFVSGDSTLLTDGKSRNELGPWSQQGDLIAYTSTRRTGQDTDLWVMNPDQTRSDRMVLELKGGGWSPMDWAPDDAKILLAETISINESYLWLVDVKSGEKTSLTPRDTQEKVSYKQGRFSKDGKGIYVTTDKDSEFLRLAYVDLATKEHRYLTDEIKWDVTEFDISDDGKFIAFAVNEAGLTSVWVYDIAEQVTQKYDDTPFGVISGLKWHKNGSELAFTLSNGQIAGDVYTLKFLKNKFKRWTYSESAIKTDTFSSPELVEWESFDKQKISGFLYKAPSKFTGKRPVLVVIHGGPEAQSFPSFQGRNNYLINELGIDVLLPNVRGSTGYGKTFTKMDNGVLREDSYRDINALFDYLATRPDIDASRVCVTGGSYGGHMTLAVSAFYNDRIRCGIAVVGMSNLVTFLERTEGYRRDLRRVEYGDEREPTMREFLQRIAPMNNIDKMKKPMMIVQGKNDPRVPATESDQIVAALKKQKTPVWYLTAEDEGHGFKKKANQDFQFYALVEFLKLNLLK